jgi:hypothetical protein
MGFTHGECTHSHSAINSDTFAKMFTEHNRKQHTHTHIQGTRTYTHAYLVDLTMNISNSTSSPSPALYLPLPSGRSVKSSNPKDTISGRFSPVFTCMCVCAYVCMYVCAHVCVCMYVYMHTHTLHICDSVYVVCLRVHVCCAYVSQGNHNVLAHSLFLQ